MARPTKYDDSVLRLTQVYIDSCNREQTELPTIEGLALTLQVDDDTIVEWAKIHKEFSAAIKQLKSKQKNQLMNDGLYGGKEINTAMAIFLLKANHGLVETSHTDVTSNGKSIPILNGITNVQTNDGHEETNNA